MPASGFVKLVDLARTVSRSFQHVMEIALRETCSDGQSRYILQGEGDDVLVRVRHCENKRTRNSRADIDDYDL